MSGSTRIWTPIDFEADGKQCDWLRLPHSTDLSAYGCVPIPLICLRNGDGPTALLVAGNHGDEYEGEVALLKLARALRVQDIRGRVIILPALNFPAVEAGRRVSPLDGGNLNRMFPGNPFGSPTEMIAHYVCEVLIPMADLHSGGRSLQYVPSVIVRPGRTQSEQEALLKLTRVFGAPVSCISSGDGGGGPTTLAAAAEQRGVAVLTTELGGAATLSPEGLRLAEQGLMRLLKFVGIAPNVSVEPAAPTRIMAVRGRSAYVYAPCRGIFEPTARLGEEALAGQLAGRIHHFDQPARPPERLHFQASGLVCCRRFPSLAELGDCLFKLVADLEGTH